MGASNTRTQNGGLATSPILLLHRRAGHVSVRAEDAAVAGGCPNRRPARRAVPKKLTAVLRHLGRRSGLAVRTRNRGRELNGRHRSWRRLLVRGESRSFRCAREGLDFCLLRIEEDHGLGLKGCFGTVNALDALKRRRHGLGARPARHPLDREDEPPTRGGRTLFCSGVRRHLRTHESKLVGRGVSMISTAFREAWARPRRAAVSDGPLPPHLLPPSGHRRSCRGPASLRRTVRPRSPRTRSAGM